MNLIADKWEDYACLDAGNKKKVEQWKNVTVIRPDPVALWNPLHHHLWKDCDAHYLRSASGGGQWEFHKSLPESWKIQYKHLTFKVALTGFKHTGLFPEQAANWEWMMDAIAKSKREINVLNLFAYTGGASIACASAGAHQVVHVDASKGIVQWAKENMVLSHLEDKNIRFIVDDVLKFVQREKRRGRTYQAIIMDPPSYGRGTNKEVWKIEDQINKLIEACLDILDDDPLFFLINSYTSGFPPTSLKNILKTTVLKKHPHGYVDAGEIGIPIKNESLILPCGIYGRWISNTYK